jgi:ssDNA-binding Zn-finger/Zn-ribbon topoisomerase 1
MKAHYKCMKCNYEWQQLPTAVICPKCSYIYIKWINYKKWKSKVAMNEK